jgi:hypothetical protein
MSVSVELIIINFKHNSNYVIYAIILGPLADYKKRHLCIVLMLCQYYSVYV